MTRQVHTATTTEPVATVAARLRHLGVAALPVLDAGGHVVGVVSELDLLRAGAGAARRPVGEVARTPVRCLSPGASVADAADLLVHDGLRSMPVVLGDELVGVVSQRDLLAGTLHRGAPAPVGPGRAALTTDETP